MELTPDLQEKKTFLIEGLKKTYKDQYDAIQPLPYIKDKLYCVDKIFVEGGVEVCLAPGSWERLESYKSIYTDFRFKSKRRIIQGEPGYGKSTLTLQLAYDWCNDESKSPMNNVEILILLRLRQLGRVKHLFGAIKSFLLSHEPRVSIHDIEKIINSCSSVHITFDGYDEYPGRGSNGNDDVHRIIKMELFADFDVSLTTRYLPDNLREETKRAKLTGFDDKARDEYIRKAVVDHNDEAVEEIKQRLYENSILADLCQVPLVFVMFAHMAHDERDIMKFKSVTHFFKHMIRCFYDHLKRKYKDNRSKKLYLHEMEHHELDKIAFEGLNKKNQQLSWIKTEFRERVGPESYDQYILIGILVEEDVVSDDSTGDNVLFTTMVRFYHKLFCEWYAAHHLVTRVKNAYYLEDKLMFLDPSDLQYLFRFACGLDPDAGKKLINHLKSLPGGDTFAILCILEQTGDVNDIMDAVKDLCSRDVKIKSGDSALLQRSTTQLLEIASKNDIPISCLHLDYSSVKFEGGTIILHSGISLPILPTVEKIHIAGSNAQHDNTETLSGISYGNQYRRHDDAQSANQETLSGISYRRQHRRQSTQYDDAQSANQETLTERDILNLFRYGMKCRRIKELMFDCFLLPLNFSSESIPVELQSRNIKVFWSNYGYSLDLQSGIWKVHDIDTVRELCSKEVDICRKDSELLQRCTIKLLENASNYDIPISCLYLKNSFSKIDAGDVILHSGIRLSCPASVKKVVIRTGRGREMPATEVVDIFMFVQQSHILEELGFDGCLLPLSIPSKSIPVEVQSRNIKVFWSNYGYSLDLQTGVWKVDDVDTFKHLCTENVNIAAGLDSELQHRCTIKLLENASNHDIPISCLYMYKSISKIDAGDVILHSGLRLSCPVSVKKVVIVAERGREMTETEVVDIVMSVQQSHMLEELEFVWCLLPHSIPTASIPSILKSRNVIVTWKISRGYYDSSYTLNLQSGRWMDHETRQELTDTEYCDTVRGFRKKWRNTDGEKARLGSEKKMNKPSEM